MAEPVGACGPGRSGGAGFLRWAERTAEALPGRVSERLRPLPVVEALALLAALADGPSVRIGRRCREGVEAHVGLRDVELGGLLLGRAWLPDPEMPMEWGGLVEIEEFVPAEECESDGVSLAMSAGVWTRARERQVRGLLVVGWYHSHPNLGAFFSGTDRRTQRSFFSRPFQVGLVTDPWRKEEAWFAGAESVFVPRKAVVVVDDTRSETSRG